MSGNPLQFVETKDEVALKLHTTRDRDGGEVTLLCRLRVVVVTTLLLVEFRVSMDAERGWEKVKTWLIVEQSNRKA